MLLVNAHEIFSQYDLYFSAGSHFAQNLKMTLPSLSLNLEAQYHTQSWTQSGATYSQEIIEMVYVEKKIINVLKNFTKTLHFVPHAACVYAPPGQTVNCSNFIFCRYITLCPQLMHLKYLVKMTCTF